MIKNINSIACLIFTLLLSSCKDGGCNTVLNSFNFKTMLNPDQASSVKVPNGCCEMENRHICQNVHSEGFQVVISGELIIITN